jgi:hypothetical protein
MMHYTNSIKNKQHEALKVLTVSDSTAMLHEVKTQVQEDHLLHHKQG